MNTYDLIMKDIKDTIRKYMEYRIIYNPMFAEKKCTEFCISSNHNQTGIQKDISVLDAYQNIYSNKDYLFMFSDGGFIQIDYKFTSKMISSACLIYFPYPSESIYDGYLDKMKTYLRIEYSIDDDNYSTISHPRAHIHIGNYNDLRLGVKRIPILSEFMELVLYLNYHEYWKKIKDAPSEHDLVYKVSRAITEREDLTLLPCLQPVEADYFSITL